MLRVMTMLTQRRRAAGLVAAVLLIGLAPGARADEEPAPPSQSEPAPRTTTTKEVVSTEPSRAAPNEPTPPQVAPAPLPQLPSAAPPNEPTAPSGAPTSTEPPAPSEYDYAADTDPAALEDFRDTLSPYGAWEEDATYGVVWVPSSVVVGVDFAPYVSHGHWGLGADSSWIWISDFSWGWAPFHYGRWVWIGGRGWAWIPGRVYAPAWVVWRTGFYDDYYVGWAPMPPTWYWRRGWAFRLGFAPPAPYVFCSATYVFSPHVRTYIAPPARIPLIAPRTRPYVAASPSVGSPMHSTYTMTRGPSMGEAHVPTSSIPAQRVSPDPRATSFARMHPPSRSFTSPSTGAFTRGDVAPRPSTLPSARSGVPGPQPYSPRPLTPPSGPMQPIVPSVPRSTPVAPMPRPYSPPTAPVAPTPHIYSPPSAPAVRPAPFAPSSPAPVVRPAAPPAANVPRPSAPAPHSVAPAARPAAPVAPRISK